MTERRWSTDGRAMPVAYNVAPGPVLCDQMGERCGSRRAYETHGCRGEQCRATQRDQARIRRREKVA